MTSYRTEPVNILIIDSNPDDANHIQELLNNSDHPNTVHTATTGEEALDFIHQRGDDAETPLPQLILLSPHLGQTNGYEILEELKNDSVLKRMPVIVLADSAESDSIIQSYELNANAHIVKPESPDDFAQIIENLESFWLSTAHLPPLE